MLSRITIEVICHATEDWERIEKALSELFGLEFERKTLMGHWSNPILLLSAEAKGKRAEEVGKKIARNVKIEDFAERSEKGAFFLRLDKESAVKGEIKEGKDIRVIFHLKTYPASAEKVAEEMKSFWGNA